MKASDLFVRCLEAEGVDCIFAVPGEENLDLLESLRSSSINLIVTRHEQAAGFMAATYGRLTGTPGVCMATLGPGATNLVTCAAFAQLGAMPLVMITGQKPIRSSKQGAFQIIDVVDMMTPITKYTRQVVGAGYIPSRVREAFRRAREERPGATHLELPEDILREEVDAEPLNPGDPRRPVADDEAIRRAVERLKGARRPLLAIASGANRTRTCHRIRKFVDHFNIPFITTQMGKGVVDERSPCYVGTAALSSDDFVHRAVEEADLIVNVGHNVVEKPPFIMKRGGTEVIHIDFGSAEVDPVYFPQVEVVGDIAESFRRIMEGLGDPPEEWDVSHVERIRKAARDLYEPRSKDGAFPLRPQRIVADVREAVPEDGIVCLDNGMYKIWFARNYSTYHPNSLLLDNALATMGAGLPTAMAAKMVHPDRPVVAVCGDGGFMMNSQDLETAVRLELDLVVLVLRDDGYGMIRWKQKDFGFPDYGLSYGNPDFVRYADAYGARGHRVESADGFAPLVARCLEEGGVQLVDVPVDYGEDNYILNEEIPELVRKLR
jgi:acetolactate synthase I/II/III large subunit